MNIRILGPQVLRGEITPSGSKNSAVALIPATLMFTGPVVLENIPDITDVHRLVKILHKLGSDVIWNKESKVLEIDNSNISMDTLNKEDIGNMRGTSLLWGSLLSRFGHFDFRELPGGCTLGARPLSPHYKAFMDLGVKVIETEHGVMMDSSNAKAREILLEEMSPTATENVIMLAVSLSGTTVITGAASEPQVQDLCTFLNKCGASISGIGSNVLIIKGGHKLKPVRYKLLADHYEITTFLAMAAATGGSIVVNDIDEKIMAPIDAVFKKFSVNVDYKGNKAILKDNGKIELLQTDSLGNLIVKAQPWPALPVDTVPLFIPLALSAKKGQVLFHNWMYEAGLFWTSELKKMGANIIMADPHRVILNAGNELHGAQLEAPYIIRAVVAMVMCAMIAKGETVILNAEALYRGHPDFADNLKKLGGNVEEIVVSD